MAWADGSVTLEVEDWGPYIDADNDYSGKQQKLKLVASTNSSTGKLNWTLTASNNYSGGVATCIYLKIGSKEIYNNYWTYANRGDRAWNSYPTGDGSASGSIDIGTSSSSTASFSISLKLCCAQDARSSTSRYKTTSGTLKRTWWTANTAGKAPKITDSGNNHFTITGNSGTAGTSNSITETKLQYKLGSGDWITDSDNSLGSTAITAAASAASQTISARTRYKCQRGGNSSGYLYSDTATLDVKNYVAPSAPSGVYIDYTKNRFTIKENWTLKWTAGKKTNDSSAIVGYRIRIYKNGKTIQFKDSKDEIIASGSSSDYYYDRNNTDTTMNINTTTNAFAPGDTVKVYIHTYTKNGAGTKLFSSGVWTFSNDKDKVYTVQNAGVMRVKGRVGGTDAKPVYDWREGQVWVKVNTGTTAKPVYEWVEADVVKVKKDGSWEESE